MEFNLKILKALAYPIVGAIYAVHSELGPGLNEYVYQEALALQLNEDGIEFEKEKEFTPIYHSQPLNAKYRLDFCCMNLAIVECKAVDSLTSDHRAQLFNYMRLTKKPIGVLVNFAQKSAVVERYFYNDKSNEICDVNGEVLLFYKQRRWKHYDNEEIMHGGIID